MNKKTLQITALLLAATAAPLYCMQKDGQQTKVTQFFKTQASVQAQQVALQELMAAQQNADRWGSDYEAPEATLQRIEKYAKLFNEYKAKYGKAPFDL